MNLLGLIKNETLQKEFGNFILDLNIKPDDVICSIVYEFVIKLPYSMDYFDEDYVPGDFLNLCTK